MAGKVLALSLALASFGCSERRYGPINFGPVPPNIYYRPAQCKQQPDKSWVCQNVRIVPRSIDAKNPK